MLELIGSRVEGFRLPPSALVSYIHEFVYYTTDCYYIILNFVWLRRVIVLFGYYLYNLYINV